MCGGQLACAFESPGRGVTTADQVDEPVFRELPERPDRFFQRGQAIVDVRVVDIDAVDTEPRQATLDGGVDSRDAEAFPVLVAWIAGLRRPGTDLGGDGQLVAVSPFAHPGAEQLLAGTWDAMPLAVVVR